MLFPANELNILAYNRVVRDLHGLTVDELHARLAAIGRYEPTANPVPAERGTFCIYVDGGWHALTLDPASIDRDDPVACLDVDLLQRRVLEPVLGIGDPRTDERIDFVGGIRGTEASSKRASTRR